MMSYETGHVPKLLFYSLNELSTDARLKYTIYIGSPLIFIGLIVNSLTIITLQRDRNGKTTTRIILISISMSSLGQLIADLIYWYMQFWTKPSQWIYTFSNCSLLFTQLRTWLYVLVAIERLLCFNRSNWLARFWTAYRIRACAALILGITACFRIPAILFTAFFTLKGPLDEATHITGMVFYLGDLILHTAAPLFIQIFLFIQTELRTCKMKKIVAEREQPPGYVRKIVMIQRSPRWKYFHQLLRYDRLFTVLRILLVIYMLSFIPNIIVYSVIAYQCGERVSDGSLGTALQICTIVDDMSCLLLASAPFFIYMVHCSRYRRLLRSICHL